MGGGQVPHRPPGEVHLVGALYGPAPAGGGVEADPQAAAVLSREPLLLHVVQHGLSIENRENDVLSSTIKGCDFVTSSLDLDITISMS